MNREQVMSLWKKRAAVFFAVALGGLWLFYVHGVLLKTGHLGDDIYNSQISGALIHLRMGVWTRTYLEIKGWVQGMGRFYPLSAWTYALYHYVHSVVIIKVIVLTVVSSSFVLFGYLVKLMNGGEAEGKGSAEWRSRIGLVALGYGIVVSVVQYRPWFDPVLGFCFLVPMVANHLLISWIFWVRFLTKGEQRSQWLSLLFFIFALLTYEVTYPMGAIHFLLALTYRKRFGAAVRASRAIIVATALILLMAFSLRSPLNPYFKNAYLGSNLALDLPRNLKAFWVQFLAPLPGIYHLVKSVPWREYIAGWEWIPSLAGGVVVFLAQRMLRRDPASALRMILFGVALWILPAALMAVSGHRDNLINTGVGNGYLPVFLQYFGVVAVLLGVILLCARRERVSAVAIRQGASVPNEAAPIAESKVGAFLRFGLQVGVSILFVSMVRVHVGQNRWIAFATNADSLYPRQVPEAALKKGLLDEVEPEILLVRNERYAADHTWFFSTHSNKKVHALNEQELFDRVEAYFRNQPRVFGPLPRTQSFSRLELPVYLLTYQYDSKEGKSGYVYFGRLEKGTLDRQSKAIQTLLTSRIRIYDYSTGSITEQRSIAGESINFVKLFEKSVIPAGTAPVSLAWTEPRHQ